MGSRTDQAGDALATGGENEGAKKRSVAAPIDLSTRLALRIPEAAAALGLSEGCFRQALPAIEKAHVGKAVLIPITALNKWLHEAAKADHESVDQTVRELLDELG